MIKNLTMLRKGDRIKVNGYVMLQNMKDDTVYEVVEIKNAKSYDGILKPDVYVFSPVNKNDNLGSKKIGHYVKDIDLWVGNNQNNNRIDIVQQNRHLNKDHNDAWRIGSEAEVIATSNRILKVEEGRINGLLTPVEAGEKRMHLIKHGIEALCNAAGFEPDLYMLNQARADGYILLSINQDDAINDPSLIDNLGVFRFPKEIIDLMHKVGGDGFKFISEVSNGTKASHFSFEDLIHTAAHEYTARLSLKEKTDEELLGQLFTEPNDDFREPSLKV